MCNICLPNKELINITVAYSFLYMIPEVHWQFSERNELIRDARKWPRDGTG